MQIDQKLTLLAALVKQSSYKFDETYRNTHGVYYEFVMKASNRKKNNCGDCVDAMIIKNTGQAKALDFKTSCRNQSHAGPPIDNDCYLVLKVTWHDTSKEHAAALKTINWLRDRSIIFAYATYKHAYNLKRSIYHTKTTD